MSVSNDFLEYILDQFSAWDDVSTQRMFGGAGLYRHGKMFGLVFDDVAYLKVDETNRGKYEESGSSPFKPFPERPTSVSYFEIPADILEDPEELIEWSAESLSIQQKRK
ncbi:DNA transformation protein [Desulfuromusa kysingii]|uniref:DNA transformation protein n=1 Tax=Desulfuromusa kysingii TaxID=37625 RepID=A0A1H4AEX1_9BACT|nr:TfoX/Sxy family protein [Desulfuromusa kysingii]SEA34559.1 DNA transformation protein [Desulfuromusa kysingii]